MTVNRRQFLKMATTGVGASMCSTQAQALQRETKQVSPDAVGMLYDSTLCIGCKACMVACKETNGMPVESTDVNPMWDTPLETSGKTLNVIKLYKDGKGEHKDQLNDGFAFPFVHLAIVISLAATTGGDWFAGWLTFNVVWEIAAGVGCGVGDGQKCSGQRCAGHERRG